MIINKQRLKCLSALFLHFVVNLYKTYPSIKFNIIYEFKFTRFLRLVKKMIRKKQMNY